MNPLETLSAIPEFDDAVLVKQLSDGLTHCSFVIQQQVKTFVLRIDKPMAQTLGLNRLSEFQVQKMASGAGLASKPLYHDIGIGVFIRDFIPGTSWTETDIQQRSNLKSLAELLGQLHALPATGSQYDPLSAMERYASQTGSAKAGELISAARKLIEKIDALSPPAVPCHNDLVYHNILQSNGTVSLLDWEYAGVGDPFFDLAIVIQHHGLSEDSARLFLETYLRRSASEAELLRLGLQCELYGVLLKVWLERVEGFQ